MDSISRRSLLQGLIAFSLPIPEVVWQSALRSEPGRQADFYMRVMAPHGLVHLSLADSNGKVGAWHVTGAWQIITAKVVPPTAEQMPSIGLMPHIDFELDGDILIDYWGMAWPNEESLRG